MTRYKLRIYHQTCGNDFQNNMTLRIKGMPRKKVMRTISLCKDIVGLLVVDSRCLHLESSTNTVLVLICNLT